jgi:hypothetical protein
MLLSKTKREGPEETRTGSTRALLWKNGELLGLAHSRPSNSIPEAEKCQMNSTYKEHYKKPIILRGPHAEKKQLVPYSPNSLRNRPPVKFENEPIPYVRHCAPQNEHHFEFKYGRSSDAEITRFRTTQRNTYTLQSASGPPVGFSNPGIVSEQSKWIKRRLED